MYCRKCGQLLPETAKFCSHCGEETSSVKKNTFSNHVPDELVVRFKNGDQDAFEEIYKITYSSIRALAYGYAGGNSSICEDYVQEIYLHLWEKIHVFTFEKGIFYPWFKRIATNKLNDIIAEKNTNKNKSIDSALYIEELKISEDMEESIELENTDPLVNPEEVLDRKETTRLLQEILNTLSEEQRRCILLYYSGGYKQDEISQMLNIPKGTIKSRLFKAKQLIEAQILLLEKQGTKLYSMSPIGFFIWLLRFEQKTNSSFYMQSSFAAIRHALGWENTLTSAVNISNVMKDSPNFVKGESLSAMNATTSTANTITSTASAASAVTTHTITSSVITKGVAILVGTAVIGTGGGVLAHKVLSKNPSTVEKTAVNETTEEKKDIPKEPTTKPEPIPTQKVVEEDAIQKLEDNLDDMRLERYLSVLSPFDNTAAIDETYLIDMFYTLGCNEMSEDPCFGHCFCEEDIIQEAKEDGIFAVRQTAFDEIFSILDYHGSMVDVFENFSSEICWVNQEAKTIEGYMESELQKTHAFFEEAKQTEMGLEIHYILQTFNESTGDYYDQYMIATLIPADTPTGYIIQAIKEVKSSNLKDLPSYYQEIVKGYVPRYPSTYYCCVDLNNDRSEELIVSLSFFEELKQLEPVVDVYTSDGKEAYHVGRGDYRSGLLFCQNGMLCDYYSEEMESAQEKDYVMSADFYTFNSSGEITWEDLYEYTTGDPSYKEKKYKFIKKYPLMDITFDWKFYNGE